MPQLRSVPEPEAARPAPPAPALGAVPRPAAVAEPLPASVANMIPEPAPPVPVLDPVAPPPSTVKPESQRNPESPTKPGAQRKPEPKRAPVATTVATLDIPGAATGAVPALQDRAQIERVAGLYRGNPGTVRVVGYAAGPAGGGAGADPLASYHAALERAQTVAKALTEAGIPASKIQTEASPASGARAPGRVEIQLAQ
jgi:outer membrane protein OmpA-like peptidoglycan-associated protein